MSFSFLGFWNLQYNRLWFWSIPSIFRMEEPENDKLIYFNDKVLRNN